jgi:hypothetical protein
MDATSAALAIALDSTSVRFCGARHQNNPDLVPERKSQDLDAVR